MSTDPKILDELHDALVERLNQLTSGDEWLSWLRAARVFHRYSPANQMLLLLQGATGHVASYRTWQRIPAQDGEYCQVRRGERGLVIVAPMTVTRREIDEVTGEQVVVGSGLRGFRPVRVFHQGQLVSPPDLPPQPLPTLLTGENRWQHVWASVSSHLEDLGYSVGIHDRAPTDSWNGRTDFLGSEVLIMGDLEPPQRLKTLLHEWGHIALGHADSMGLAPRQVQELEAESVAYLLSSSIGLDSTAYSVPYLASWAAGDPKLVHHTAQHVLTTTASMVATLEQQLSIELAPDLLTTAGARPATDLHRSDPAPSLLEGPAVIGQVHPHPVVDGSSAELAQLLLALEPPDQALLVEALEHLDTDLDIATALCADAGLSAQRTHGLLLGRGADPDRLRTAMGRPIADVNGDRSPLFTELPDTPRPKPPSAAAQHPAAVATPREDHCRQAIAALDLSDRQQVLAAAAMLASIGEVDAAKAAKMLFEYGARAEDISAALRTPVNPVSDGFGPRRPPASSNGDADTVQTSTPADVTPTVNGTVPARTDHLDDPHQQRPAMSPAEAILAGWAGTTPTAPPPPTLP